MRNSRLSASLVSCLMGIAFAPEAPAQTPLTTTRIVAGLTQPVAMVYPPGDTQRLFIVEKQGRIKILRNGVIEPTPFLDISSIVNATTLEWGLLYMTFDPDYATNGYLYVNYNDRPSGNTVIARYQRNATNPDIADFDSRFVILYLVQPSANHRGAWLDFDRNGYLYDSQGDGGGQQDPSNRAQNLALLQGKILRIDPSGDDFPADPNKNYRIPPSNPFVGVPGAAPEIWAYGLRNPWRCSFDRWRRDLWIADVGQNAREEVNFQLAASSGGQNYGWRCMEGTLCTGLTGCTCFSAALTMPVHEYNHSFGVSVTGGYVYRGCAIPDLRGTYFFADYQSSRIWSLRYRPATGVQEFRERTTELDPVGTLAINQISSFAEDQDGELYIFDYTGELFKIVPNGPAPAACPLRGDLNCDNGVNFDDITPFVTALVNEEQFYTDYPRCNHNLADANCDGVVNFDDISSFVSCIISGACPACP